ncbi:MAG TPA: lytic transglycosylase domain-containing protein [Candidatus Eisenbacteria bacterium]|nr:lytic transglycosylase domain-containing protein [Candidatus Eisenbacteria bacterium]
MPVDAKLVALAHRAAEMEGLEPALVCAVVEQESGWNPWAMRYEPAFFAKYVAPLYTNNKVGATEAYARGISWGLMQVMGQTAREKGASGTYLSSLCDPAAGLAIGCKIVRQKLDAAGGEVEQALRTWNGGANPDYADEVLARVSRYR